MIKQENKYTNLSGTFPSALMIDASGAGLTDGSEFAALPLNDGWEPFQQAVMDYAAGNANAPTGTPGTPNGVADAKGISQMLQALQVAHGIGPGNYVPWGKYNAPATYGDRVILLAEQGVLIATYPELDAACYVGDGNNAAAAAAGEKFYRSSDAGGATPNVAGPYIQLPAQPAPTYLKQYSEANGDFTVAGTGWTTTAAIAVPFKDITGAWNIFISIEGSRTVSGGYNVNNTLSGVSWANESGLGYSNSQSGGMSCRASGTNTLNMRGDTATTTHAISGFVPLSAAPTFADDFYFKWGIRY